MNIETKDNKKNPLDSSGVIAGIILGGLIVNIVVSLVNETSCQMSGLNIQCNLTAFLMQFEFFKLVFTMLDFCFSGTSAEFYLNKYTSIMLLATTNLIIIASLFAFSKTLKVISKKWKSYKQNSVQ